MGTLVPFEMPADQLAELKELFGDPASNNDLSEGVQPSFAVVSFKGKVWRVKYKGEEQIVKHPETGDPLPALVCVIVKGSPQISKIYYEGSYTEGSDDAPKCFSIDGVKPDPGSEEQQCATCAACPKNVWGSKVTEQGNKTKACSDSRRLAVVPYPDIKNEAYGGPLLLRVPPASLQELDSYNRELQRLGYPYNAVVTKITFDHEVAFPKLKFSAARGLTMDEARTVLEMKAGDTVGRMLAEAPIVPEGGATSISEAAKAEPKKSPAPAEEPKKQDSGATANTESAPARESAGAASQEASPAPEKEDKPTAKEANDVEPVEVDDALGALLDSVL